MHFIRRYSFLFTFRSDDGKLNSFQDPNASEKPWNLARLRACLIGKYLGIYFHSSVVRSIENLCRGSTLGTCSLVSGKEKINKIK